MSPFRFEVWPSAQRQILQYFGASPERYAQFGLPGHDGVDIEAADGSQIRCVAPGRVRRVHANPTGHNYGIHVRVTHPDGYQTIYGHLQQALVREGQLLDAGTVLGLAGSTGNSFTPHLHLGLKKAGARQGGWPQHLIDPMPFLLPLLGWREPDGPFVEGWVRTSALFLSGNLAQVSAGGAQLRLSPAQSALIPAGTFLLVISPDTRQTPDFVRVLVPYVALGLATPAPPALPPAGGAPAPTVATLQGWGRSAHLVATGAQGVVSHHGLNLRDAPTADSHLIGLVRRGSPLTLLGPAQGDYLPLQVRRTDFVGPVRLPLPTEAAPQRAYLGWVRSHYLERSGRQAVVRYAGIDLRQAPADDARRLGLLKGFATAAVAGQEQAGYTPIFVRHDDVLHAARPMPPVQEPVPLRGDSHVALATVVENTPGWLFAGGLHVDGTDGVVRGGGLNLRTLPRRDAPSRGFVAAQSVVTVTGSAQGEYVPVRVDDPLLTPPRPELPDTPLLGRALLGLHASADPDIGDAEHEAFAALRPGLIKLLSFHGEDDIRRLAQAHPAAHWIVRAFLDFGGRAISPRQFVDDTIDDVRRALGVLQGKNVWIELHNEPNVAEEGFGTAWQDGAAFTGWWLEVLDRYRDALPAGRFLYPGLSPGSSVGGRKQDHVEFLEASRAAVKKADGLGVHLYWSDVAPSDRALAVLDDIISRFRTYPIWITEASHNGPLNAALKARQYLAFWKALHQRPAVRGVTFFVASASNPAYADEVWVGRGIAEIVGKR